MVTNGGELEWQVRPNLENGIKYCNCQATGATAKFARNVLMCACWLNNDCQGGVACTFITTTHTMQAALWTVMTCTCWQSDYDSHETCNALGRNVLSIINVACGTTKH